ncbi:TetR/AcrR family transcriptional regulator [Mycolicibacterium sp. P9-22]|uniref:TetR/AcrR family transcriptional regulator n=1 Tax=Mycolicibacterium sp. P9-22 TaxID=2024613 RepID=UPI0011EBDE0A|nr:TetR/AcrR family transcriptional regulator [Mycolicibacterium sp. P9-22]KAA0108755.1 TetR/AcrR family transcriptional regulator [Mycolicibacterium sp. P9-22]
MPSSPSRPRNAAATRAAILQSAIGHFADAGYDGAGVRQIAKDAGVTAMLVNRYFGSKEQLFAEAVETAFAPPVFVTDGSDTLAGDTAATLVSRTGPSGSPPESFLIMLLSVSNPVAVRIVREAIERHVGQRLARQIDLPDRELRTELVLAVISGVLLMRSVIGTRALRDGDPGNLAGILESVFGVIIGASEE